jgi:hypothetical protein
MRRFEKIGVAFAMSLESCEVTLPVASWPPADFSSSGAVAIMRSLYIVQLSQQDISCECRKKYLIGATGFLTF